MKYQLTFYANEKWAVFLVHAMKAYTGGAEV
jgi:hypothetical protein